MRACPTCGSENLDDNLTCGVCGTKLSGTTLVPSHSIFEKTLLHFTTGPAVAFAGWMWFSLSGNLAGIILLGIGLLLILASLSKGPSQVDRWKYPYAYRNTSYTWFRVGEELAARLMNKENENQGEDEPADTSEETKPTASN